MCPLIKMRESLGGISHLGTCRNQRGWSSVDQSLSIRIAEIIKGCVQKYPTSVDVLNEYEVVITMLNEMIADIVAKDLESMEQWGCMHNNIHCTIVSKNRFRPMLEEKCETSPKVSTNVPIDKLVEKMMNNIMTQVDEKIRAISESSLPRVSTNLLQQIRS